jgi:hypothetical protein
MVDSVFDACEASGRLVLHTWGAPASASRATRAEARENVRRDLADTEHDVEIWQARVDDDCAPKRLTTGCFDADGAL